MMEETIGLIDINTCARVVGDTIQENVVPLGIICGVLIVGFAVLFVLYMYTAKELALSKEYLRKQKKLNDYEDWKKDREIKV